MLYKLWVLFNEMTCMCAMYPVSWHHHGLLLVLNTLHSRKEFQTPSSDTCLGLHRFLRYGLQWIGLSFAGVTFHQG